MFSHAIQYEFRSFFMIGSFYFLLYSTCEKQTINIGSRFSWKIKLIMFAIANLAIHKGASRHSINLLYNIKTKYKYENTI